ncbi:MAG: 4a-hydroxytetrahydrobiopterin dehydratase [Flavobacteriaceae bacterium]|nr:4a-hydroxytetrahydrobiopterin dehydratase [Flavobacteriaceae bacterium]
MEPFSEAQIEKALESLPNWEYAENAIHTALEFESFKDAFSIMTRIAFEAEKMNHHPNWFNVYNRLEISLSTHDAGGITQNDIDLAKVIDSLVS